MKLGLDNAFGDDVSKQGKQDATTNWTSTSRGNNLQHEKFEMHSKQGVRVEHWNYCVFRLMSKFSAYRNILFFYSLLLAKFSDPKSPANCPTLQKKFPLLKNRKRPYIAMD